MYSRIFQPHPRQSYLLLGPRGTGKSSWLNQNYKNVNLIDLLDDELFLRLSAQPKSILDYVEDRSKPILIDEIQKIPSLLDEVHRLIEQKKLSFVLTGSSARKLKKSGANLLAGRALTAYFHPLTSLEMGADFSLKKSLKFGLLPSATKHENPKKYLESYVRTYLKEEVIQEGLARNLPAFSRFLQAASFSQAAPLNVSKVASDCAVERKVVEDYFHVLRDLLLSIELPVFTKRAKRELLRKKKFFFFDCGVYQTLRPRGPLDSDSEINGPALETLVLQNIRVLNEHLDWGYDLFYWHTRKHEEVDLILYGPKGLIAIEVKTSARLHSDDFVGLDLFAEDYPMAKKVLIYGGSEEKIFRGTKIAPAQNFFNEIERYLT